MPRIKYVGPFDEVEVDGLGVVPNGEYVEVDADLAKSLLDQPSNWAAADKKPAAINENKES